MTTGEIVAIAFCAGWLVGWLLNRKPHQIEANLVIDEKMLEQINTASVNAWLDKRGMTWMPKGAVYDPNRSVKK